MNQFANFRDFYAYYLSEHKHPVCRRLHFVGSTAVLLIVLTVLIGLASPLFLLAAVFCGYGFAWVGHFFFEHNRPATFQHPFYSFCGDWVMYKDMLVGKISF